MIFSKLKVSSTNAGVPISLEKGGGIERREFASSGLPAPVDEIRSVGFVAGDAIPALENLLAGVVVPWGSPNWVMNPGSIREVTGELEGVMRVWRRNGCVSYEREEEENGDEAEKRNKGEERDSFSLVVRVGVVSRRHGQAFWDQP